VCAKTAIDAQLKQQCAINAIAQQPYFAVIIFFKYSLKFFVVNVCHQFRLACLEMKALELVRSIVINLLAQLGRADFSG